MTLLLHDDLEGEGEFIEEKKSFCKRPRNLVVILVLLVVLIGVVVWKSAFNDAAPDKNRSSQLNASSSETLAAEALDEAKTKEVDSAHSDAPSTTSDSPSLMPTFTPTNVASSSPSSIPTYKPSFVPSVSPTPLDSSSPSFYPTFDATLATAPVLAAPVVVNSGPFQFMQCADPTQNCCNGLDTICDLGVDDILYASVHNAMSTVQDGFIFFPNHLERLEGALSAGYRGINLDVCNCGGDYQFCHGVCNLGSRDVEGTFSSINSFLEQNPTEVLLINLQIDSDAGDAVDLGVFYSQLDSVTGVSKFTDKIYVHVDPNADWPTLRQVVEDNTRVLMFHYNGPQCNGDVACPPGLHYWFDYAMETEFSFDSIDDVFELPRACAITRGSTRSNFFGVNSFVSPPRQSSAETINAYDFAKDRIANCSALHSGLDVNVVYVDFWSDGDLPQITQEHNRAVAQARRRKLRRKKDRLSLLR